MINTRTLSLVRDSAAARARASSDAGTSTRVFAVDLARAFAVLFMVQGHALDVLLAPEYRVGTAFNLWLFLRGLTAPLFLSLSGFAFVIVTMRRWESHLHNTPEMRRRVCRFCSLILLGYFMHMPVRSPLDISGLGEDACRSWLQVDVLQCIGFTLLVLQLSVLAARTPRRFAVLAASLGGLVVIGAHFAWSAPAVGRLPVFFAAYCNGISGSLFPLFPWSAYVCAGAWFGVWYMQRSSDSVSHLLTGGLLMIIAGVLLEKPAMRIYGDIYFWKSSPSVFILRMGCVSVLLSIFEQLSRVTWIPRGLTQAVAQQSLLIYLVHLYVLYGSVWNRGLRQRLGPTLDPPHVFLWISFLLVSMTLLAWSRSRIKRMRRGMGRRIAVSTPESFDAAISEAS